MAPLGAITLRIVYPVVFAKGKSKKRADPKTGPEGFKRVAAFYECRRPNSLGTK